VDAITGAAEAGRGSWGLRWSVVRQSESPELAAAAHRSWVHAAIGDDQCSAAITTTRSLSPIANLVCLGSTATYVRMAPPAARDPRSAGSSSAPSDRPTHARSLRRGRRLAGDRRAPSTARRRRRTPGARRGGARHARASSHRQLLRARATVLAALGEWEAWRGAASAGSWVPHSSARQNHHPAGPTSGLAQRASR